MSKSVDERVVQMEFDNKNFESNAKATMSTLDKLKEKLNFKGASKGVEEINNSVKGINLGVLSSAVETVSKRFSTLGIIGVTALQNITNQAINTAKNLVNELTLAPIMSGFQEYETQIGSIQTILANTSSQGTTLNQVTAALDELNTYADQTIYNFTEMTRNIGTFTAAGVDLKTSTEAIKGIANLAAMSGSTSAQASTAMYQLSQALAAGRVSLQDWNSVVNAGMGGKVFQDALMQTAETMGIAVDRSVSFRESISATGGKASWLTSDVLLQTLRQFTGDLTDAELAAQGFNEEQIKAIQAQAKTANEAATQVKTLTQLFDTAKEAVGSGWTQTWEIIVGDFDEAKELFTDISNVFGEFVNQTSEARNNLLEGGLMSGWKQFLNEGISNADDFVQSIRNVSSEYGVSEDQLDSYIEKHGSFEKSLREGWMTADILTAAVQDYTDRLNGMSQEELEAAGYTGKHVEELNKLNDGIKSGSINIDEFITKMNRQSGRENIIEGLSEAFRVLLEVLTPVKEAFDEVFEAMKPEQLYDMTVSFRDFFKSLSLGEENAKNLKDTFQGLFSVFDLVGKGISTVWKSITGFAPEVGNLASKFLEVTGSIGRWITSINEAAETGDVFTAVGDGITSALQFIFDKIDLVTDGIDGFGDVLSIVGNGISAVFEKVFDVVGRVFNFLKDNISFGDIFAGFTTAGVVSLLQKVGGLADKIKEVIEKFTSGGDKEGGLKEGLSQVLDSVHESLQSFQEGIKVASLVGIAGAVTLLVSAIDKLSTINPISIGFSLGAIEVLMLELNASFAALSQTVKKFDTKGTLKAAVAMMAIAKAVDILSDAMVEMSGLDFDEIVKGLLSVGGVMVELGASIRLMGDKNLTLRTSVAILALAKAVDILSDSLIEFSKMSLEEIGKGLLAMGGALGELSAAIGILSKVGGGGALLGGIGILITSGSLYAIAENLERLSQMSWEEIERGLYAMGTALGEFTVALGVLSYVGGGGAIAGGVGVLVAAQSLYAIAENLERLGQMSWEEIGKGLTAMGVALAEVGGVSGALGYFTGISGIFGGGAIWVAVQGLDELSAALQEFADMTWDEIGRGLTAMGVALLEVGGVSGALGYFTGIAGIFGSGAIWIATQGLDELASAMQRLGFMSWEDIQQGLVGMGGALLEVAVVSGALGWVTGLAGLVGAGTLYVAIQALDDLSAALKDFASLSWDEVGRGLAAMGGALGSVALGSLANTFSFLGAGSLSLVAEPLGKLADSMKKWKDVTIPENLPKQLTGLAEGILAFNFSGWGADAISTFAVPIGDLADSMKKWAGVNIPEGVGDQIGSLADGIGAFNFSGWGADAISTFAVPIGDLADSVKKWENVTLPETLGDQLTSLADGVGAFTFSGWGADAMSPAAEGLSALADAIAKWKDVTLPEGLGDNLTSLANGVNAFSFAFVGGWSISSLKQPLIDLAEAVSKWKNVSIPDALKEDLTSLADGIGAFSLSFLAGWSLDTVVGPLGDLADSVKKWVGVDISGVGPQISEFAEGVKSLNDVSISESVTTGLNSLIMTFNGEGFTTSIANMKTFVTTMNQISMIDVTSIDSIKTAFANLSTFSMQTLAQNFTAGISSLLPMLRTLGVQTAQSIVMGFDSKLPDFIQRGKMSGLNYQTGLTSQQGMVRASATALGDAAVEALNSVAEAFKVAGQNAGAGFVEGLNEYASKAAEAAAKMANSAVNAVNSALDEHSPSRVLIQSGRYGGEGLALGFLAMIPSVESAASKMTEGAIYSIQSAIGRARDVLADSSEMQPTIRPVVDLSDVQAKASMINQAFGINRRYSVAMTASKVSSASSGFGYRQNGNVNTPSDASKEPVTQSFNFTQNNYSPKALNRSEIYRQTNNQFTKLKNKVTGR